MTRKSPTAPRQEELTRRLSLAINERPYLFVNSDEMETESVIPNGEWRHRLEAFLDDPETSIGSDPIEREWAKAMITRRYKRYLNPGLVQSMTACLKPVKRYMSTSREERLDKVKRDIKKLEDK